MIRVVLVDDEPQSCKSLAIKIKSTGEDIEVVGTFHDPEKAVNGLIKLKPHAVFLDIEMPGMNGFQILEKIQEYNFEVIFITAYSNYMLNALHISALDYLLKPVDIEELKSVLTKLRKRLLLHQNSLDKRDQLALLSDSLKEHQSPKKLALTTLQGIIFLNICEIIRVEALSNYSTFYLVNNQKIVVSKTLKEYEALLTHQHFFRVSRSCIVNTDYIFKYKHEDGGVLELKDGTHISVGPHRKNELIEMLSGL